MMENYEEDYAMYFWLISRGVTIHSLLAGVRQITEVMRRDNGKHSGREKAGSDAYRSFGHEPSCILCNYVQHKGGRRSIYICIPICPEPSVLC